MSNLTWREIAEMPAIISPRLGETLEPGCRGVHESVLRGYQLVAKVKDYLARGVPADVILELIDEVESAPAVPALGEEPPHA